MKQQPAGGPAPTGAPVEPDTLLAILEHPEQAQRLRDDPSLWDEGCRRHASSWRACSALITAS